jgi:hypothetical protein
MSKGSCVWTAGSALPDGESVRRDMIVDRALRHPGVRFQHYFGTKQAFDRDCRAMVWNLTRVQWRKRSWENFPWFPSWHGPCALLWLRVDEVRPGQDKRQQIQHSELFAKCTDPDSIARNEDVGVPAVCAHCIVPSAERWITEFDGWL